MTKNERPHNVNSCDKCSCKAGGNGYCNHMFILNIKCLNSLNSKRTGMYTTQNSSTNQGPRVRKLIHIMHTRHIMSSVLITGINGGFKVSLIYSQATYCPKLREGKLVLSFTLKTINCPAIVSTYRT